MLSVTVPRSDITAQEVSAVLQDKLGSGYHITHAMSSTGFGKETPADENTMLVTGSWLQRANVKIVPSDATTEIQVSPGVTHPQVIRLFDRFDIARKVHRVLEQAPELTQAN